LVRPRGYGARGKASMLRDKLWRDFRLRRLYKLRGVGEGFFSGFSLVVRSEINSQKVGSCRAKISFEMPALQPENLDQMLERREWRTQSHSFGDLLDTPLYL